MQCNGLIMFNLRRSDADIGLVWFGTRVARINQSLAKILGLT